MEYGVGRETSIFLITTGCRVTHFVQEEMELPNFRQSFKHWQVFPVGACLAGDVITTLEAMQPTVRITIVFITWWLGASHNLFEGLLQPTTRNLQTPHLPTIDKPGKQLIFKVRITRRTMVWSVIAISITMASQNCENEKKP